MRCRTCGAVVVLFATVSVALLLVLKRNVAERDEYLVLETVGYGRDGKRVTKTMILRSNETLFYVDAWRSHWCPYYNDRAFFLTPRINEMLHLARSRGFRAFHLHWKGHETRVDGYLRKRARNYSELGETAAVRDSWVDNGHENSKYIPGFKDACILSEYQRFNKTRCQKPNPTISVARNDLVAFNFKSVANIAHHFGIRTVVVMGMHTNMCIRSAAMYLGLVNITVVYVRDLLDSCYWYKGQKKHGVTNHSRMNAVAYGYSIMNHGMGVETQDLMTRLLKMRPLTCEPEWLLYPEASLPFRRYYRQHCHRGRLSPP